MSPGHFWTLHVQRDASASVPLSRYISKTANGWSESALYNNDHQFNLRLPGFKICVNTLLAMFHTHHSECILETALCQLWVLILF